MTQAILTMSEYREGGTENFMSGIPGGGGRASHFLTAGLDCLEIPGLGGGGEERTAWRNGGGGEEERDRAT